MTAMQHHRLKISDDVRSDVMHFEQIRLHDLRRVGGKNAELFGALSRRASASCPVLAVRGALA